MSRRDPSDDDGKATALTRSTRTRGAVLTYFKVLLEWEAVATTDVAVDSSDENESEVRDGS